jgi:predicted alpha/beta hydrolase
MTEFDNQESESSETIQTTKLEIITDDAIKLGATYFTDPQKSAKRAIMTAGATAVPQRFYADFAKYLAAHDCAVLTFDYRGVGDSRPNSGLKNFQATHQSVIFVQDLRTCLQTFMQAKIEYLTVQPEKFDLKAIGHLNFFRRQSQVLWPIATAWFSKNEETIDCKLESF